MSSVGKNVEKLDIYAWLYEIQIGANSMIFLKKLKIQLCCDAVIPLLGIYIQETSKESMCWRQSKRERITETITPQNMSL